MSRIIYLDIENYDDYFKSLKRRKCDFELCKTSYSRKIKEKSITTIFNQGAEQDFELLPLINSVREDAVKYIGKTNYKDRENSDIQFFDFFKKPDSEEIMWKVDVKSAYWIASLKRGSTSEETNDKLLEIFKNRSSKEMKSARLKALGSLATRKTQQWYESGKMVDEIIKTEITKGIYMEICRDVDLLMRDCVNNNQTVIYYYWDCIFVPKNTAQKVVEYFRDLKYDVTVEETKLAYVDIFNDGGGYITSESDSKAYMVRKESLGLIENL